METFYQGHGILTILIFLPLLGALAAWLAGNARAKHVALWVGIAEFVISLPLFFFFQPGSHLFPIRRTGSEGIVLRSFSKQIIHIVIHMLHTGNCSLFLMIPCRITLSFDKFDLDVPTDIPSRSEISL